MRPLKQQIVQDMGDLMQASESFYMVTYRGLTAEAFAELRATLEDCGTECHVVPNRLFRLALDAQGVEGVADEVFVGDTALITGSGDPVAVAKVLRTFSRAHPELSFKQGVIDGKVCSANAALSLADLPPREVQLAQLLGLLQAPAGQLVGVLHAKLASLVYVLNAYLSGKQEAA